MPVRRIMPEQEEHPDLIQELARVLREDRHVGPPDEPEIIIEQLRHSDSLHVTAVWDRWDGIDPEERGRIILEAFAEERGEAEMLRITMALGVTRHEACRLGIPAAGAGAP